MSSVIKISGLSKSYLISHEKKESYTLFRDVMARKAKKIFSIPGTSPSKNSPNREEFWALKDITFDVEKGDRVGIIGRNGAGKSTLLKIISRIIEPTHGTVKIKGRIASLLEVGTGFHPELTGRENIFLNGAILGMSRKEIIKKFDEIVAFAEVEKFLDTPVKRYSSGMHVRLAFAVAANLDPEILLVDEVLAVGDAQFQKKCIGKMEDVNRKEGRTILFVSHNMSIVNQFCNKAVLLESGKLSAVDSADKILDKYLSKLQNFNSEYNVSPYAAASKANYFNTIFLQNNEEKRTADFSFNENINLDFSFNINDPISKIHIIIDFKDRYQSKIFSLIKPLSFFNKKDNICQAKIKLPSSLIAPGFYSFAFTLMETSGEIHDYVENVCPCQIHDSGVSILLPDISDQGNIIINPEWTII